MSYTPTKANYVPLLNRLSEMRATDYYATAYADLLFAEQAIISLERELAAKTKEYEELKASIPTWRDML